jgi:multidrug efflux pump subunit AcrA (membrane-fusion protein)
MSQRHHLFDLRDEMEFETHNMNPSWWMKYGITTSFLLLVILLVLSSIIRYPDIIYGEFRIMSNTPSITIPLAQNVQIEKLLKKNGEQVKKGNHIMVFKNSANHNDLLDASRMIDLKLVSDDDFNLLFERLKSKSLSLGEIQGSWMQLYSSLFEHYSITELLKYEGKIRRLNYQLDKQKQLNKHYNGLLDLNKTERGIITKFSHIDSVLFSTKAISRVDYLTKQEEYILRGREQKQNEIASKRNELEMVAIMSEIEASKDEQRERLLAVRINISETVNKLKSDILTWKKTYLIEAPINGTLNFLGNIDENGFINSEENAIVITPERRGFKAIVKIPLFRSGKVEAGQNVHLKLNDYPYREFGHLSGTLTNISDVAGSNHYQARVNLGTKLQTNYKKIIYAKENMTGSAEIITEDRSLLSRVLDKFIYIFRNR